MASGRYIPAAGRRGLTALYDPVMAATMRERRFRRALIERALSVGEPSVVLDLGCGTGTLAIQLARAAPHARVIGLDGDPEALRRSAAKATRAGVELELLDGSAAAVPLAGDSVDCVVCSLLLHHLSDGDKQRALAEAGRVLRADGLLLIAGWGAAQDLLMRAAFVAVRLLDGFTNTRMHVAGELPVLIEQSGFALTPLDRLCTAWGTLELLAATPTERPAGAATTPTADRPSL